MKNESTTAKILDNVQCIERIEFKPMAKSDWFIWTNKISWTSFWTRKQKTKIVPWSWRESSSLFNPEGTETYEGDHDLIEHYPHLSIIKKVLYTKAHVIVHFVSGRKEVKWFPDNDTALRYWKSLVEKNDNLQDLSEPRFYTSE